MDLDDGMSFQATGISLLRAAGEARRLLVDASLVESAGGASGIPATMAAQLPVVARAPCWLVRRGCARLARTMSGQATRLHGDGTSEQAAVDEAGFLAGTEISWLAFNGVLGPRLMRRSSAAREA